MAAPHFLYTVAATIVRVWFQASFSLLHRAFSFTVLYRFERDFLLSRLHFFERPFKRNALTCSIAVLACGGHTIHVIKNLRADSPPVDTYAHKNNPPPPLHLKSATIVLNTTRHLPSHAKRPAPFLRPPLPPTELRPLPRLLRPKLSVGGALSHHQHPTRLPRLHHRCHPRGGGGGRHPHRSFCRHPRSHHPHGCGPHGRDCRWVAVSPGCLPPTLRPRFGQKTGAGAWSWAISRALINPPPCRWPAGGFWYDFSLVLAPVFPPYRRGLASP